MEEKQRLIEKWKEADTIEEKSKILAELYEKYNPLQNQLNLYDGDKPVGTLSWKIIPELTLDSEKLQETEFEVRFNRNIIGDEVKVEVIIDGEVSAFVSGPNDDNFKIDTTFSGGHVMKGGARVNWDIAPAVSIDDPSKIINESTFRLNWEKDLIDHDVTLNLSINGKSSVFHSGPGDNNLNLSIGARIGLK